MLTRIAGKQLPLQRCKSELKFGSCRRHLNASERCHFVHRNEPELCAAMAATAAAAAEAAAAGPSTAPAAGAGVATTLAAPAATPTAAAATAVTAVTAAAHRIETNRNDTGAMPEAGVAGISRAGGRPPQAHH